MSSIPPGPDDPEQMEPEESEDREETGYYEDSNNLHRPISAAPILKRGEILENQGTDDNPEMQSATEVLHDETIREIQTNINYLPEPYRTAVRLHYLEGYSYPDIVRMLQLPIGTIKSHVSRGKKMLKELPEKPVSIYQTQLHTEQIPTLLTKYTDKLREPYRTSMELHYLNKYSYHEIAHQLQQPVGTIKSYISRGTRMLYILRDEEENSVGTLESEEM